MKEEDDFDDLAQFAASTKGRRESVIEPYKEALSRLRNEFKCSISDMHEYLKIKGLSISYEALRKYVNANIPLTNQVRESKKEKANTEVKITESHEEQRNEKDNDSLNEALGDIKDGLPPGVISSRAALEKKADAYVKPSNSIITSLMNKSLEKKK
jgi:hypothetical protein